ncbi:MAG: hypothetical protein FJX65_13000 [Alphaproteobacteria bacterium]|nr:hypothetical protein [Alphaproteobacteria bacterium]
MKAIRVQYTVKAEYAAQNRRNIASVMEELRALGDTGCRYASYCLADGKTFMHLVHYRSTDAEKFPGSLASFKRFQEGLKGNLEIPPKPETLDLADSSFDIF